MDIRERTGQQNTGIWAKCWTSVRPVGDPSGSELLNSMSLKGSDWPNRGPPEPDAGKTERLALPYGCTHTHTRARAQEGTGVRARWNTHARRTGCTDGKDREIGRNLLYTDCLCIMQCPLAFSRANERL